MKVIRAVLRHPSSLLLLCGIALFAAEEATPPLLLSEPERAAAMRALLAPGRTALPGGKTTLAAAVAALSTDGNRVVLADDVDARREALLPAFVGPWWEGVRAVCTAFSLRFDEGLASSHRLSVTGMPLPVGHGTLVLSDDPSGPPAFTVSEAIAVVVEGEYLPAAGGRTLAVRAWARAEPRLPRGRLAWARASDASLSVPDGSTIALSPLGSPNGNPDGYPPALLWKAELGQTEASTLTLSCMLHLATVEDWSARRTLRLGGQDEFQVAGQTIHLALFGEDGPARWLDVAMPERRPCLAIIGPKNLLGEGIAGLLSSCQIRLPAGQGALADGTHPVHCSNGSIALFRHPPSPSDGPLEVILDNRVPWPLPDRPLHIPIGAHHHVTRPDPDTPSHLRWPSDRLALARWIALLAATGNAIQTDSDVDTSRLIAVPEVDGTFWDGVLAVCAAADLAPVSSAADAIFYGPLRLGRRQAPSLMAAASGPVLVLADPPQVIHDGQERDVQVRVTLIAEPRCPTDHFQSPAILWSSLAGGSADRPTQVLQAVPDPPSPQRRRPSRQAPQAVPPVESDASAVALHIPDPATRELTLNGLLVLQRMRRLRVTGDLPVEGMLELVLGSRLVELATTNTTAEKALSASRGHQGLLLRGFAGFSDPVLVASTTDGAPIDVVRLGGQWLPLGIEAGRQLAKGTVPANGHLAIEVTAREPRPPLAVPLRLIVPFP